MSTMFDVKVEERHGTLCLYKMINADVNILVVCDPRSGHLNSKTKRPSIARRLPIDHPSIIGAASAGTGH
jgi:hypothetical protein